MYEYAPDYRLIAAEKPDDKVVFEFTHDDAVSAKPHTIHHLTASILAQEGVGVPTIQAILRHKNPMTTTRYLHRLGITENVLEDVFGEDE